MTSGYRIYRYNGWYHVYYNHCNSHPDGLGLWSIAEIPRNPDNYRTWLENLRTKLSHNLEKMMEAYAKPRDVYGDHTFQYYITNLQPVKSSRIQWIWEIDCDNEIMHVDGRPMFCLSNVPRDEAFLSSIALDNYGHRACSVDTPVECRYNWKANPPPVPCKSIALYRSLALENDAVSTRALFELPELAGTCETIRTNFYQTLLGTAMRTWTLAHKIPQLEQISERSLIPDSLREFSRTVLELALHPMIFSDPGYSRPQSTGPVNIDCHWLRHDVCLRLTTHLDDRPNLQESIASLILGIRNSTTRPRIVYGIAFSFTHIVIARITFRSSNGIQVSHTAALQFLPSFFATSPSTPGISALMDLSFVLEQDTLPTSSRGGALRNHAARNIPTEIWHSILRNVTSISDLRNLGTLTPQSRSAVSHTLRYPHVAGHRLVRCRYDPIDTYWVSPRWCRAFQDDYLPQDGMQSLYSQKFDVVHGRELRDLVIQIGPGDPPLRVVPWMWSESHSSAGYMKEGQIEMISPNNAGKSGWIVKYRVVQDS